MWGLKSKKNVDPLAGFSDDELQRAALRLLPSRPQSTSIWLGGTVEQRERVISWVAEMRAQFAEYEPKRMRRHLLRWCDFFEEEARDEMEDIRSGKGRREMAEYRREIGELAASMHREAARTQDVLERLRDALLAGHRANDPY